MDPDADFFTHVKLVDEQITHGNVLSPQSVDNGTSNGYSKELTTSDYNEEGDDAFYTCLLWSI